jgi:hypothetical protein
VKPPHSWEGVCDLCRIAGRPIIRVVELEQDEIRLWLPPPKGPIPEKMTLHLCAFCPVVVGLAGVESSRTCGLIPNGHTCNCGRPATRWLEAAHQFFCADHGPDKAQRLMGPAAFKSIPYASGVLWERAPRPGLWNIYEVAMEGGKVVRGRQLAESVQSGQALLHIQRVSSDRVDAWKAPRGAA